MFILVLSFFQVFSSDAKGLTIDINTDSLIFSRFDVTGKRGIGTIFLPVGVPQKGDVRLKIIYGKIPSGSVFLEGPYLFRKHRIMLIGLNEKVKNKGRIRLRLDFPGRPFDMKRDADILYRKIVINGNTSDSWTIEEGRAGSTIPWSPSGIKVATKESGVYRISSSQLTSMGIEFNPPIDSINLSHNGKNIPILIEDVNMDGIFNSNDFFVFFSPPAVSQYDTLSYYWINKGQESKYIDLQIDTIGAEIIDTYRDSIYINKDSVFSRKAGEYLYKLDTLFTIVLQDTLFVESEVCSLKVRVFNPSSGFDTLTIDVDGSTVYSQIISGSNFATIHLGLMLNSSSSVKISSHSYIYLDYLILTYTRKMVASGEYFSFKSSITGKKMFVVKNFSGGDPIVLRQDGYRIFPAVQEDGESYTVSFADTVIQSSFYLIYTPGSEKRPVFIKEVEETDKFENLNSSEMLIITTPELYSVAEEYKRFHEEDSISASVFTTDEIYDAFNYGEKSPYAIKDFLRYVFDNTSPPPVYLFLVGKGTYDRKNISGSGSDLIPVLLHRTPDGYFASDYLYSFVDDDFYPDLIVGRLPCITESEADAYLNKLRYGRNSPEPFENRLFFGADYALQGADVESDKLINSIVPSGYNITRVYSREGTSVWKEVIDAVNNGVSVFNFHGHGSEEDLGAGRYFRVYDIPRLNNFGKLNFMLAFTCANGVMDVPDFRSVGEMSVVFPGVGSIGSIGPSGFTYFDENLLSDRYFLNSLFRTGTRRMGDVLYSYKFTHPSSYNSYVYLLIGDPAYSLDIPDDSLRITAWQHSDSITIKGVYAGDGDVYFTLFDSTSALEFHKRMVGGVAETTFNYIPLSVNPRVTGLLKSNNALLNGETNLYSRDVFTSAVINPENPLINDTLTTTFILKFVPDSARLYWRYGSDSPGEKGLTVFGETLQTNLVIEKEKANLSIQAGVFDSGQIYYSRWYNIYIKERANLRFSTSPYISASDTSVYLYARIINSGEFSIDSAEYSVYMYVSGIPVEIYSGEIFSLSPGASRTISIPISDTLISSIDTLIFRIELDPLNQIDESSETDNTAYYNSIKGIYFVDENTDTTFFYNSLYIKVEEGDFASKSIIVVEDSDFPSPVSQRINPVKINGKILSFRLSFNNLRNPIDVFCLPDSTGQFYIFKEKKWVLLPGSHTKGDTVSSTIQDTGNITVLSNHDTIPPLIIPSSDTFTVFRDKKVEQTFRLEDQEGIDLWVSPPIAIVDGDTQNMNISVSRDENLYNAAYSGLLDEGSHHISFVVRDVNGNVNRYEKDITITIPFEIEKISNYPNPAISHTTFGFILTKPADRVVLEIFQPDGKMVKRFQIENPSIFPEFIDWDLRDEDGRLVGNGVYGYRITAERGIYTISKTGKMAVMKR